MALAGGTLPRDPVLGLGQPLGQGAADPRAPALLGADQAAGRQRLQVPITLGSGAVGSLTRAGATISRARIARRGGSASAGKVASSEWLAMGPSNAGAARCHAKTEAIGQVSLRQRRLIATGAQTP
jgi:hypothetical protein